MRGPARAALAFALLVSAGCAGCKGHSDAAADPGARSADAAVASTAAGKMRVTEAPAVGEVDAAVRDAMKRASAEHRRVVVYVGATWCEPCQRFHHAAERGELDSTFPDVDLLTYDMDRDARRLVAAGYVSKLIPLFALPGPDGRASGKQVEGGIKGEGAVGFIAPRLQKMLEE
ncbi:MAG: thioredoxin [Polyangiaceae bacterium]